MNSSDMNSERDRHLEMSNETVLRYELISEEEKEALIFILILYKRGYTQYFISQTEYM